MDLDESIRVDFDEPLLIGLFNFYKKKKIQLYLDKSEALKK